ncbi:MAG TPA: ATP synthase F1 subunit delta [Candidatus Avibacteroides faecavium]|nr:ATP synthase F1 subunit delta [Candidatus Avibacteroides faecavium]
MYLGVIARRYATALADCAVQRDEESHAFDEAGQLLEAMKDNIQLRQALSSPILRGDAKSAMLRQAFKKPMCSALDDFIQLVIRHHRETYLEFMLTSFQSLCKERHHISEAVLTTATPVEESFVKRVAAFAQEGNNGEVRIRKEVRPDLIGGFIFRIGDVMIDASISTQIARLKRTFSQSTNRIV